MGLRADGNNSTAAAVTAAVGVVVPASAIYCVLE